MASSEARGADADHGSARGAWRWLTAVRGPERSRFAFFLALMTLLSLAQTLGLAGSEALLIGRRGAGALPAAFILAALTTVATSLLYATVVGRQRNDALFARMLLGAAALLLAGAAASLADARFAPLALFCAFFITQSTFMNHFWTFASDHFDTLASKRIFPLFTVGGSVGGAAGGALAALLSTVGPPDLLIAGWGLALTASALLLLRSRDRLLRWGPLAFEEEDETSVQGLRAALRYARGGALGRWLVLSAAGMVMALFVSQYLYSDVFSRRFPTPEALAAFFGLFLLVSNGVEVVVEVAITPWLIRRFGLATANLAHPFTTFAAFAGLAVDFQLGPALFARANRELLDNALAQPVRNLVYNAVPQRLRGRMRALLEGIVVYSGMAVAGAVLLLIGRPDPLLLCGVGGVIAVLYLAANVGVRRAYLRALVEQLRQGRLDLADLGEGLGGAEVDRLAALWAELLAAEDEHAAPVALELAPLLARRGVRKPLIAATTHPDPRLRHAVVLALSENMGDDMAVELALRARVADDDPRVRAQAAASLGAEFEPRLASLAAAPDPAEACAALELLPPTLARSAAVRVADPDAGVRAAALEALARLGSAAIAEEEAIQALRDPSAAVRRAAVRAVGSFADGRDGRYGRDGQDGQGGRGGELLDGCLDDDSSEVRAAAAEAIAALGEAGVAVARARIGSDQRHAVASALDVLGRIGSDEARGLLREAFRERVLGAWHHLLSVHALGRPVDPAGRFLHAAHVDGVGGDLGLAFRALGRLEGRPLVRGIERALRLGPAGARTEALEVLSNLGDREAAALLTLFHEEGSLEDRIRGVPRFASRPRSADAVVAAAAESTEHWIRFAAEAAAQPAGSPGQETMERLLALRRVSLFAHLSLDQLDAIARIMRDESYVVGEVVVREGEPGSDLYVLLEGEVAVYTGWGTPHAVELNRMRPVSCFGEMAVLHDSRRSASVVVTRDARLARLGGQRLKELILQMPEISFEIFRELIERVRRAETEVPPKLNSAPPSAPGSG